MIFFKCLLYPLLVINMKSRSPREENVALCTLIDFWTKYLQFKYTVDIPVKSWFAKLCARKKLIIGSLSNDDGDGKENGNSWIKFDVSTAEAYMTSESIFWFGAAEQLSSTRSAPCNTTPARQRFKRRAYFGNVFSWISACALSLFISPELVYAWRLGIRSVSTGAENGS